MTRPSRTGSPSCGTGAKPRGSQLELVGDARLQSLPALRSVCSPTPRASRSRDLAGPRRCVPGRGLSPRALFCLTVVSHVHLGQSTAPWCPHLPGCPSGERQDLGCPSPCRSPFLSALSPRVATGGWGQLQPFQHGGGPRGTCGLALAREAGCCCVLRNRPTALGPHWSWASSRGPGAPGLLSASPTQRPPDKPLTSVPCCPRPQGS